VREHERSSLLLTHNLAQANPEVAILNRLTWLQQLVVRQRP
jgi:hypothetical protein